MRIEVCQRTAGLTIFYKLLLIFSQLPHWHEGVTPSTLDDECLDSTVQLFYLSYSFSGELPLSLYSLSKWLIVWIHYHEQLKWFLMAIGTHSRLSKSQTECVQTCFKSHPVLLYNDENPFMTSVCVFYISHQLLQYEWHEFCDFKIHSYAHFSLIAIILVSLVYSLIKTSTITKTIYLPLRYSYIQKPNTANGTPNDWFKKFSSCCMAIVVDIINERGLCIDTPWKLT